jgi:hypothetical protein
MSSGEKARGKQTGAIVIIGVVCFVLFGCSDKPAHSPEYDAEQSLMSDVGRAMPELIQRLHTRATLRGGVLLLRAKFDVNEFQAFPSVPPWKADCAATGLDISFVWGSDSDNHVRVSLTEVSLTDDQCATLLPTVAAEAKTYLSPSTVSQDPLR